VPSCPKCPPDKICSNNTCICPPNTIECNNICENKSYFYGNQDNCGNCGIKCEPWIEHCIGNECKTNPWMCILFDFIKIVFIDFILIAGISFIIFVTEKILDHFLPGNEISIILKRIGCYHYVIFYIFSIIILLLATYKECFSV
jgi:hypothetical protein